MSGELGQVGRVRGDAVTIPEGETDNVGGETDNVGGDTDNVGGDQGGRGGETDNVRGACPTRK